uniref:VWFA domain-containing protein n=1 Tax=Callorhinchus milii TaxID=7868 RepID=A0A4W3JCP4_CALMI
CCFETCFPVVCQLTIYYLLYYSVFAVDKCGDSAMDLVFLLDGSKSVLPQNFEKVKDFVNGIVDSISIGRQGSRVGVVQYSSNVRTEFTLDQHRTKEEIKEAVKRISYMQEGTATGRAIRHLIEKSFSGEEGARCLSLGVRRVAIVVTDGRSADDVTVPARAAHHAGIVLFTIGVTGSTDETELRAMASQPHSQYLHHVDDFNLLEKVKLQLAGGQCKLRLCQGTVGSERAPGTACQLDAFGGSEAKRPWDGVPECGGRETESLATDGRGVGRLVGSQQVREVGEGKAMDGLKGCRTAPNDLVFILDGSFSVGPENFEIVKSWIVNISSSFEIGNKFTQVGVIQYSDDPLLEIPLGKYSSNEDLMKAMEAIEYMGGNTRTGKAITFGVKDVFSSSYRAANAVTKVAIVLTDGKSQDDVKDYAEEARKKKITLFAIGVGDETEEFELQAIANKPSSTYVFYVEDYTGISRIREVMKQKLCEGKNFSQWLEHLLWRNLGQVSLLHTPSNNPSKTKNNNKLVIFNLRLFVGHCCVQLAAVFAHKYTINSLYSIFCEALWDVLPT